ncbi:zinc finger domain-containing protein [Pseudomonas aeruginosa]|nr:Com family DNA-binding transcriptional regulator [Pseudomonas aeruginosa]HBO6581469.1 Com family DNA-binding transcriptional regulator [Pseudomonas aeruginosa]HDQ9179033.1 Com family DNA-binding transcriptional regulator [Pseudomonas aeruginosa]HDQ9276019.1 Com family DNA-binding transcriptional regulator [Pseudomonas aeruginosa]HDQ9524632.1 Com family DNA-binding transcriptional regulator [Pseudomonas aeruginosa]
MLNPMRCGGCERLLAKIGPGAEIQIKCPRCGTLNHLKAESLPADRLERPRKGCGNDQHQHP